MNPDQPNTPPNAPEPETNPVPPPEPQPEQANPVAAPVEPAPVTTENAPVAAPVANNGELPSAFSLFKPSWEALKLNLGTFIILGILPLVVLPAVFLVSMGANMGVNMGADDRTLSATVVVLGLLMFFFVLLLTPAVTYTQVKSAQGQKVSVGEAFKAGLSNILRFWGTMIVAGFLILGGFILLIIPGLFMIKRYFLTPYAIFTENAGVMDTLKKSAAQTKGRGMAVWGVIGVTFLISLVGIIPIVGWIASIIGSIMYYCAPAVRWEQLRKLSPAPEKA